MLGSCRLSESPSDGKLSREHYFSRGLFLAEHVEIEGLLPLALEPGKRHINDLITKCLCRKHNAELSELDQALIDLLNAIRETERLRRVREPIRRDWPITRLRVDGARILRCAMKMVLTHAVLQKDHLDGWRPPVWLADVVFGKRSLPEGCGLATLTRVGDAIVGTERASFGFGTNLRGGRDCALLELRRGWRFFCTWDNPIRKLHHLSFGEDVYMQDDILFPLNRVEFLNAEHRPIGLTLDFDWSGRWSPRKNLNVVALRDKYRPPPRPGSKTS